MQLIDKMWSRCSFFEKSSLPNELASRGFTEDIKMPAYLYREDGMKLWNAIGDFAKDFVDEIYESDEAVASDEVVQDWAKETTDHDKGAIKGFPTSFENKDTVVKVLQTLMWVTSGLHAAVNFPQYDFFGFAPNKPFFLKADLSSIPKNDAQIREWMFENMFSDIRTDDEWLKKNGGIASSITMQPRSEAVGTLHMVRILTAPSFYCIDNLSDKFATTGTEAYAKFLKKLNGISEEINARNEKAKKAKKAEYNYLNPSNVPVSIDIQREREREVT